MTNSKTLSKERYTQFAEGYITSTTHAHGAELDRLVEVAQPQAGWVVLDIATGGGHTALKFAPYVQNVVATDLTARMLEKAQVFLIEQKVTNVSFRVADAEDLPFADGQFDLVTCRIAPHHFLDAAQFVRESARVLKAGGVLLVQDHLLSEDEAVAQVADSFEKLRDPSHNHAFCEAAWRAMFAAAGLSVEYTEQLVKRHDFIDWAQRQGCTPQTITQLEALVVASSEAAKAWMQPLNWGTPQASFMNHHLIIAGHKKA